MVGIPDFDYSNQMSAVAAFLRKIEAAFITEGYSVELGLNSQSKSLVNTNATGKDGVKNKLKSLLKKSKWLYHSLAFRGYFKRQDQLLQEYSKKNPFDLVIEFHTVGSTLGLQLANQWQAKFAVVFDSPVEEQFYEMHGTKSSYWSRILKSEKQTMEGADAIMAYSPACERHLRSKYAIRAQVTVLPCVVSKNAIENKPDKAVFNIGFIGSFLSWHKVDLLVRVFEVFYQKYPQSRLQLVGYGMEWDKVKQLVDELRLTAVVDLPGFVSEQELLDFKANFTVAIMPGSNWYGSPLKLFEYAESQIPFIAPKTKTVAAIFEQQQHCLFIDPKDEFNSIFEHLEFLINQPDFRNKMATQANHYVHENYRDKVYQEKLASALAVNP